MSSLLAFLCSSLENLFLRAVATRTEHLPRTHVLYCTGIRFCRIEHLYSVDTRSIQVCSIHIPILAAGKELASLPLCIQTTNARDKQLRKC
jgi:hypothetical protein